MNYIKYNNYREMLENMIRDNSHLSGIKTRVAKAANIQPAYLSHVLAGTAQFTLEHAFAVCRFFKIPPLETEHFMALVENERTTRADYKRYLSQRIANIRHEAQKQTSRVSESNLEELPAEFYEQYYRSWKPAAVHVALSIETIQSEENLIKELQLAPSELREILMFLSSFKLIEKKGDRWSIKKLNIHISKESPWLRLHSHNWRQKSLEKVNSEDSISYTDVCSMSMEDETRLRYEWTQLLNNFRKEVATSHGEVLCCLNLDFFRI